MGMVFISHTSLHPSLLLPKLPSLLDWLAGLGCEYWLRLSHPHSGGLESGPPFGFWKRFLLGNLPGGFPLMSKPSLHTGRAEKQAPPPAEGDKPAHRRAFMVAVSEIPAPLGLSLATMPGICTLLTVGLGPEEGWGLESCRYC